MFRVRNKGSTGDPIVSEFLTQENAEEGIKIMAEIIAKDNFRRTGNYPKITYYPWGSKSICSVVSGNEKLADFSVEEVVIS